MTIAIEGFTVVAKKAIVTGLLESGTIQPQSGILVADDHIWSACFMAEQDALNLVAELEAAGLNASQGPDSDVVLVNEFHQQVEPYCEWLQLAKWEKAVLAWKVGTDPEKLFAREGFDPKVGSGLTFEDRRSMDHLEFVRLDGNVEVYFDKNLGKEVYIGRTTTPVEALFRSSCETIGAHLRTAGQPALIGQDAKDVEQAVDSLSQLLTNNEDWWQAWFFHGKGLLALGRLTEAKTSFEHALGLEKESEPIARELSGTYLELGLFDQSVKIGEHAVSLRPDDAESLGNLSVSYLLAGRVDAAKRTIDAANRIATNDPINHRLARVIDDVHSGRRAQPRSMRELQKPDRPKQGTPARGQPSKPWWKFW